MILKNVPGWISCVLMTSLLAGCGSDPEPVEKIPYQTVTSPRDLVTNLQVSWKYRDPVGYAALFSDDFLFYFDADTRARKNLPEFWNKLQDSTSVARLLTSPEVVEVRCTLSNMAVDTLEAGRGLPSITVGDTFLEVDLRPEPGQEEGITLQVDGQIQKFYFRKGRTPADTLQSSPTSRRWYIVEWRDRGHMSIPARYMAIVWTTWGLVKSVYSQATS